MIRLATLAAIVAGVAVPAASACPIVDVLRDAGNAHTVAAAKPRSKPRPADRTRKHRVCPIAYAEGVTTIPC